MTETKKQEKLNELVNKISLELKDATLQQGFEIICKRIAELEKENEELIDKKTALEKRIFELEKENEKIKEKYKEKFLKEIAEHNEAITELKKLLADEHEKFDKYLTETLELRAENEDLKAEIGLNEATIQEQLKERVKVIKENEELKKQIDCYKAFESHYDEIEEDAKAIAEENEDLKNQIERMKCCENCEYENFEKYHGEKCNLGNYKTCGNWEIRK